MPAANVLLILAASSPAIPCIAAASFPLVGSVYATVKLSPLLITEAKVKITVEPLTATLATLTGPEFCEIVKSVASGRLVPSRVES